MGTLVGFSLGVLMLRSFSAVVVATKASSLGRCSYAKMTSVLYPTAAVDCVSESRFKELVILTIKNRILAGSAGLTVRGSLDIDILQRKLWDEHLKLLEAYHNFTHFAVALLRFLFPRMDTNHSCMELKQKEFIPPRVFFYSYWKIQTIASLYLIHRQQRCFCSHTASKQLHPSTLTGTGHEAPLSTMHLEELHKNAMKVVCNADLTANFDPQKDVSIPQTNKGGNQSDLDIGNLSTDKRDFLAFYAGQMHGVVRPVLIDHWRGKDPSMKIYEVLPLEIAQNISYAEHMKRSRYCLCPKDFEVNSPRIGEANLSGCVPVIIADNFVLPFSDVLDWTKFSLTVAEKDIPHLKKILTCIPDGTYRSMQSRLRYIRRHFVWLEDPDDAEYDSFHLALYSIWLKAKRIRED